MKPIDPSEQMLDAFWAVIGGMIRGIATLPPAFLGLIGVLLIVRLAIGTAGKKTRRPF